MLFSKFSEEAKVYGMFITKGLNHVDFQYGKDRNELLYEPILSLINKI